MLSSPVHDKLHTHMTEAWIALFKGVATPHALSCGNIDALYSCRFLTTVQGDVRSYLQQYDKWCAHERAHKLPPSLANEPMTTMPTMNAREHHNIFAAGGHPQQPACRASPQQTSQPQHATRVPFRTLQTTAPVMATTNKADIKHHPHQQLQASSQYPVVCDKENTRTGL